MASVLTQDVSPSSVLGMLRKYFKLKARYPEYHVVVPSNQDVFESIKNPIHPLLVIPPGFRDSTDSQYEHLWSIVATPRISKIDRDVHIYFRQYEAATGNNDSFTVQLNHNAGHFSCLAFGFTNLAIAVQFTEIYQPRLEYAELRHNRIAELFLDGRNLCRFSPEERAFLQGYHDSLGTSTAHMTPIIVHTDESKPTEEAFFDAVQNRPVQNAIVMARRSGATDQQLMKYIIDFAPPAIIHGDLEAYARKILGTME